MKKLKYLILVIMLLPVTAFADAIHLHQSDFETALNNINTQITNTKIKFVIDDDRLGFILNGGEYILDEDINLYAGYITSGNTPLVLNLNGYNLYTQYSYYYNGTTYYYNSLIVNNYNNRNLIDITVNGPGYISGYNGDDGVIHNSGGNLTLNNVEVYGCYYGDDYFGSSTITLNNSVMDNSGYFDSEYSSGDAQLFINDSDIDYISIEDGATGQIINTRINDDVYVYNNSSVTVKNSTIYDEVEVYYTSTANIEDSTIFDEAYSEYDSTLNIKNTNVKYGAYSYEGSTLNIEDSTLDGYASADYSSKTVITNSTINDGVYSYQGAILIATNSTINYGFYSSYNSALVFTDCTINSEENNYVSNGIIKLDNTTIHAEKLGLGIYGEIYTSELPSNSPIFDYFSSHKSIITNSKISGDKAGLVTFYATTEIDNTEIESERGYALFNSTDVEMTLSDVHFKSKEGNPSFISVTGSNASRTFGEFLKDDYIYYNEPSYTNDYEIPLALSKYGYIDSNGNLEYYPEDYTFGAISNSELWIIKENQTYETPASATYDSTNNNEIIIPINGMESLLQSVEVNGQVLTSEQYTVVDMEDNKKGIKINSEYLQTLGSGNHEVKLTYVNGSTTSTLSVVEEQQPVEQEEPNKPDKEKEDVKGEIENPKTGLFNYLLLLIPLAIGIIVYLKVSNKTVFKRI